ncbi:hypothetical protein CDEST_08341 [Colletotrichum destructivum]|uniref:Uncharacterized protein n=1 Tax=Colletotrichum destructivum TaxID=34406 RepID=A0AAX4IJA6_9PEZI|nr:hypothetical protein CDEST_08341 [Colletotrichum destructivum]
MRDTTAVVNGLLLALAGSLAAAESLITLHGASASATAYSVVTTSASVSASASAAGSNSRASTTRPLPPIGREPNCSRSVRRFRVPPTLPTLSEATTTYHIQSASNATHTLALTATPTSPTLTITSSSLSSSQSAAQPVPRDLEHDDDKKTKRKTRTPELWPVIPRPTVFIPEEEAKDKKKDKEMRVEAAPTVAATASVSCTPTGGVPRPPRGPKKIRAAKMIRVKNPRGPKKPQETEAATASARTTTTVVVSSSAILEYQANATLAGRDLLPAAQSTEATTHSSSSRRCTRTRRPSCWWKTGSAKSSSGSVTGSSTASQPTTSAPTTSGNDSNIRTITVRPATTSTLVTSTVSVSGSSPSSCPYPSTTAGASVVTVTVTAEPSYVPTYYLNPSTDQRGFRGPEGLEEPQPAVTSSFSYTGWLGPTTDHRGFRGPDGLEDVPPAVTAV